MPHSQIQTQTNRYRTTSHFHLDHADKSFGNGKDSDSGSGFAPDRSHSTIQPTIYGANGLEGHRIRQVSYFLVHLSSSLQAVSNIQRRVRCACTAWFASGLRVHLFDENIDTVSPLYLTSQIPCSHLICHE